MPRLGTDIAWRESARAFLTASIPPEAVSWSDQPDAVSLFDEPAPNLSQGDAPIKVAKSFVSLAQSVCWHTDADRFDRLYGLLWRLQTVPGLIQDRADPALAHLRRMEKAVHRCQHKMKAFVRFREIGAPDAKRRSFAAWFEPTHHTMQPTAQFFANRFADMDWRIVTPSVSAIFEAGKLRFALDLPRPDLAEDAHEGLWTTYFCNIFNPARLKISAMTSEMPKKYWKNLPEAAAIAGLIEQAPQRARAMAAAMPTLPPARTARVQAAAQTGTAWDGPEDEFGAALNACTRCPLHCDATQVVGGIGPAKTQIMIVGEQPGDIEDLKGVPFVGPSGVLLDQVMQAAQLDRSTVYMTNAVKHFRHTVRGKRRIHQRPDRSHIEPCRFWLDAEIARVQPKIIIALGGTAALALTGRKEGVLNRQGDIETGLRGTPVLITNHPARILRTPDHTKQVAMRDAMARDLAKAVATCTPRS